MIKWLKKWFEYQPKPIESICAVCENSLESELCWADKPAPGAHYYRVKPCKSCLKTEREAGYEQCKEEL